jgi:methionyl aminopeptidase
MFAVGKVGVKAQKLIDVTYEAMMRGIAEVKPGARLGDIGEAIQSYAESHRYSVVRDFCGHGIGKVFHDSPSVLHFGTAGTGPLIKEGMFFTVEPMINAGRYEVKVLEDGWTAVTRDRSLSAQFEHTVGVTSDGVEIFTRSPAGLDRPPYQL